MTIGERTYISISGEAAVNLKNTDLTNNGRLKALESSFIFSSTLPQTYLGGNEIGDFGSLTINAEQGDFLLASSLRVNSSLELRKGNIDLQNFDLTLPGPKSEIVGENNENRIYSSAGGEIIKFAQLDNVENYDPGNLGLFITNNNNLGYVEIHRGHLSFDLPTGTGVSRYYSIIPEFPPESPIELNIGFFESETSGSQPEQVWTLMGNEWKALNTTLTKEALNSTNWALTASKKYGQYITVGPKQNIEAGLSSIPTAFTPNGDGVNDTFIIPFISDFPDARVTIVNRWGNVIYSTENYALAPWNGSYNGQPSVVATYYFVISFKNNAQDDIKGNISIVR